MNRKRILLFEDNLLWSSRLKKGAQSLGFEAVVFTMLPHDIPLAEAAIVNLSSKAFDLPKLIDRLKLANTIVVGHAGHKEKALSEHGRDLGCDLVVSNSALTFKLADVFHQVNLLDSPS